MGGDCRDIFPRSQTRQTIKHPYFYTAINFVERRNYAGNIAPQGVSAAPMKLLFSQKLLNRFSFTM